MNINIQDIERAVLATFLLDRDQFLEYQSILDISDFYLPAHQEIFKVMCYLFEKDLPIDEEFIKKYSDKSRLNDNEIIRISTTNSIVDILSYINEIKESSKKRKINSFTNEIKHLILDNSYASEDIAKQFLQFVDHLDSNSYDQYTHTSEGLLNTIIQQMKDKENGITTKKYHTGLHSLDKILDGLDDGDLIVVAARPSMGKTSFITSVAMETLKHNEAVLIESLEMSADKIMRRFLSSYSGESISDLKNAVVSNPSRFNEAVSFLNTSNLIIEDEPYPTLFQLQSKIKKALRKNPNIKNIFVDHTGKIKLDGKTREDIEIGYITNTLKKIAREYNVRVFLLQQLNRSVESRENKRPMLSDLKNSGNIEEDADIVLGLYRDSYYNKKEEAEERVAEKAEIIVLKNRDGSLGTASVIFERKTATFRSVNSFNRNEIKIAFN